MASEERQEASPTMSLWELEDRRSCQGTPRPAQEPTAEEATTAELQMKVDFFRKLGYSSAEIHSVLQKLGVQADTNTVLGELVKHGSAAERERQASPDPCPQLPLVPRGGGTPKAPTVETYPPEEDKEGSDLRPIVIDGSNVAMRYMSLLCSRPWPLAGIGGHVSTPLVERTSGRSLVSSLDWSRGRESPLWRSYCVPGVSLNPRSFLEVGFRAV